jgi:Xaa-Pro aminopeptidase
MRATRAGMREHELQAVALHVYLRHGAAGEGYRSIVPSGTERIWNAHYMRNDGLLADGDLVLMDTAPDLDNYTSDIGRMWPVSGSYGSVQRELYGFMVEYHRTLLRLIRPGVSAEQVTQEAAAAMEPIVRATRFSAAAHREAAERCLTFRGHLSHPVGMAVHDVGGYWGGVLQPGHVFAVDPQMWVPEERLYIRVEDTVAVTDDGILNLTAGAPAHPDDIEDAMRSPLEFGEL